MKQERLFELHAEVCKTLSNSVRLRIINELQDGEMTVGTLAKKLSIRQAHLSQHLSVLTERRCCSKKGWVEGLLQHCKPQDHQGIPTDKRGLDGTSAERPDHTSKYLEHQMIGKPRPLSKAIQSST